MLNSKLLPKAKSGTTTRQERSVFWCDLEIATLQKRYTLKMLLFKIASKDPRTTTYSDPNVRYLCVTQKRYPPKNATFQDHKLSKTLFFKNYALQSRYSYKCYPL